MLEAIHDFEASFFSDDNWSVFMTVLSILCVIGVLSQTDRKFYCGGGNGISIVAVPLAILTILYIGCRPYNCYGDSSLYVSLYNLAAEGVNYVDRMELLWVALIKTCTGIGLPACDWLTIIATIYVGGITLAVWRWFPRHFLLALVFFLINYSFFTYGVNGIRNGAATSIAMLALSIFNEHTKGRGMIVIIGLITVASLFHGSLKLAILVAAVSFFLKNIRLSVLFWLIAIVLSLIMPDTLKEIVNAAAGDERMSGYIASEVTDKFSRIGFRWDFIIYSAVPIYFAYRTLVTLGIKDRTYTFLSNFYIISNSFWVSINSVAFSNRFAYLSWFMYSVIIAYPLLKHQIFKNQSGVLAMVMIGCVLFNWIF